MGTQNPQKRQKPVKDALSYRLFFCALCVPLAPLRPEVFAEFTRTRRRP